jgi:hypothetical protein
MDLVLGDYSLVEFYSRSAGHPNTDRRRAEDEQKMGVSSKLLREGGHKADCKGQQGIAAGHRLTWKRYDHRPPPLNRPIKTLNPPGIERNN